MEQDQGSQQEQKKKAASLGQRWEDAQLKKTGVFWSLVAAIVLTMIIGFTWGGWVTGNSAQKIAEKMSEDAVVLRLAPICIVQFNQDPEKDRKLIEFKEVSNWKKWEFVKDQGWATMPGEDEADRKVADACADLLTAMIK